MSKASRVGGALRQCLQSHHSFRALFVNVLPHQLLLLFPQILAYSTMKKEVQRLNRAIRTSFFISCSIRLAAVKLRGRASLSMAGSVDQSLRPKHAIQT